MNNFPDNDPSGLERPSGSQKKASNPPANANRPTPSGNANAPIRQTVPLTLQDRIRLYEKPHKKLREFVVEGLYQVRDELLPLLYYSYLRLYMKIISEKLPKDLIRRWRNDFLNVEQYMKELAHIDNSASTLTEERIKEDPILHQILAAPKTISLSQFTFESLFLFIQKNNLQEIDFDVLQSMKITFKIVTDTPTEPDKKPIKPSFLTPTKPVLKLTEGAGRTGVRVDEALYMHLLQSLYEIKNSGNSELTTEEVYRRLPSFKGELQDGKTIPLPEQSLNYQIDFARSFLNKPNLNKEKEPNVLHITVRDPEENITCVEIDPQGKVMLVGFNNAKILMIMLNPKFKEATAEFEEYQQKSAEELLGSLDEPINFDTGDFFEQEDAIAEEGQEEGNGVLEEEENGIDGEKMFKQRAKKEKYEIIEFIGHEEAITSLHLHFDGLYFVSCSVDTTIRLWCVRRRMCLNIYKGHINTIWTVKFASRGLFFASGSSDTTARIWVTDTTVPIRSFLGHTSDVHLVEYARDCNNVVTASYDKSIRVWDIETARCLKILYPGNENISALGFNFYSNLLVSGLDDGTFVLWDIPNDTKMGPFNLNNDKARVNSVDFSFDGSFIVASSRKKISYFDVNHLKEHKKAIKENEAHENVIGNGKLAEKQEEEPLEANSVLLEEGSLNYSFLLTRFSPGNFIYAISRCAE